ncbi:MAG TPA: hypothetical protein VK489_12245 [Ferruginibacter sp.]|nr:hypothetical protein [Ferruginibacter sp.]
MKQLTIKAKEVKESIALGLSEIFFKDGFKYKKTINQFEKNRGRLYGNFQSS